MLLLIAEKGTTETRARRATRSAINRADMDDELEAYTTTFAALGNMDRSGGIWTSIDEPDELVSLPDM